MLSDPELDRTFDELIDLRDMETPTLPTEQVRSLATRITDARLSEGGTRMAIIAESNALFGLARLFEMQRDDGTVDIRVFRSESDARLWLGVSS